MPTVIGVVFFLCSAYYFIKDEEVLLGLLIIASAFQAASAVNVAERGIAPYYVVAAFIVMRAITNWVSGMRSDRKMAHRGLLLLSGTIAIVSAFVLPVVFSGLPVYDPKIGIDDGLFNRPALKLGLNNIGQAGFLFCQIATAFATLGIRFSRVKTAKAYQIALYIVAIFVFGQALGQFAGVAIPDSLVRNNPGYSIADSETSISGIRNSGTFAEPSIAGAFLLIYCVGFLAQYLNGEKTGLKLISSFILSGLVASSGSILTLLVFGFILCLNYFPYRFPWYLNIRQGKRMIWLLSLLIIPLLSSIVAASSFRDTLAYFTVSKGETASFVNRTASDLYALNLLIRTHGLGVGLGSNRASSFATTLISNVGVVGFLAFGIFYCKLFWNLPKEEAWLKWVGFALLFNMCLAIADITIPIFWIPIMLAIQQRAGEGTLQRRIIASR